MAEKGPLVLVMIVGLVIGLGVGYAIPTLLIPPGETTDLLDTIQSRGYMVVGTSSGWPPFEMVNSTTQELYGFDIDLCELIASELGVEIQWSDMDFDALVGAAQTGTVDLLAAAMFITPERADVLDHSIWYIRTNQIVVVTGDSTLEIESLEDLEGYTVGVQTGTVEDDELTDLVSEGVGITIQRYPRPDTLFADLDGGTLDAVYVDEPVITVYSKAYSLKSIFTVPAPPTALFMRKGNPEFRNAVNDVIAEAFADGSLDEMIEKWFG